MYENDAGILDVFQGVFVQSGGKYASKMCAAIYSALPQKKQTAEVVWGNQSPIVVNSCLLFFALKRAMLLHGS
mgnify:CR=1 FL=1